nr:transglycosylase domain-containing protein [Bacillus piscicola]
MDLISEIRSEENRRYIRYNDIPEKVLQAFLATEDRFFYEHEGVDISAVFRAVITNSKAGNIEEGASTITQQVVRNLFLTQEQTYNRKLSEVLYAYQMEQTYSKDKILELYINTTYYQNGIYGFETASRTYFGKTSQQLSLAETAFLAAIPANPSHYDPLHHKENTLLRQQWILTKMEEAGVISKAEQEEASQESISVSYTKPRDLYPDYVVYIENELKELIASREGFTRRIKQANDEEREFVKKQLARRVKDVLKSGIHIETALDPSIQKQVIDRTDTYLNKWHVQGAAVVIDHTTHQIKAMSGGANYQKYDFQRAFQAYRQPGSAIKPLLVFGPYLDQTGKEVNSLVSTARFCHNGYCPSNAGRSFYGSVSLSHAFAKSYNTAAIRLFSETGVDTSFGYLEKFGFSKIQHGDYQYPAALGGFTYGMTPLEMTKAYTVYSNAGKYTIPRGILRVTDSKGNVIYEWKENTQKVWSPETNDKLRTMMRRVLTEGTGKRANIPNQHVGGKTGTTNNSRDFWFLGYNDRYTTGVWIGQDNPSSLARLHSAHPHLTLWKEIVTDLPQ